ncbi:MAG: hypothetical protein WAX89_04440 [Alphaproteobacteria bacterium]
MKTFVYALLAAVVLTVTAQAETLVWRGPTNTLTIGLAEKDISHIEFPEPIINVTVEDQDYVDILVVEGYQNRAFRMRSLLPKMATRMFLTGESGTTYIAVATTDVPYKAFLQIVDGKKIDDVQRKIASKFGEKELIRAMAQDKDIPGVLRETYMIPSWFQGAGLVFDLSEVWQSAKMTGLVVHVRNEYDVPNEVNLPAVTLPVTDEWGELRFAAMENMRLNPRGKPNDRGILYLIFKR